MYTVKKEVEHVTYAYMKKEKNPNIVGIALGPAGCRLDVRIWVAVCILTVSSRWKIVSHAIGSSFVSTSNYLESWTPTLGGCRGIGR